MPQCSALTVKFKRCKNRTVGRSELCKFHRRRFYLIRAGLVTGQILWAGTKAGRAPGWRPPSRAYVYKGFN